MLRLPKFARVVCTWKSVFYFYVLIASGKHLFGVWGCLTMLRRRRSYREVRCHGRHGFPTLVTLTDGMYGVEVQSILKRLLAESDNDKAKDERLIPGSALRVTETGNDHSAAYMSLAFSNFSAVE